MSAADTPPLLRSSFRRALNLAWLLLFVALAAECAAFFITRQVAVKRHNANINRIKHEQWGRGLPAGQVWYDLDGDRVKYAVFHDPVPAPRKGEVVNVPNVDLSPPYSDGKVWLNLSRSERVRVNLGPPQVMFCLNGRVTNAPLPPGFTKADLADFMNAGLVHDGMPGFQAWLARRR
jgi:hypothetical protein